MTATSDRLDLPARRRRHARLVAALTTLIGACAEAAGAVYRPIAAASPGQETVEVNVWPCVQVSLTAADLLERARAEDDARWPDAMMWERAQSQRTYAARCAVAQAEEVVEQDDPPGPNDVPLPTVEQVAAMELVSAGTEVTARWRSDPEEAVALVHELAGGGELAVGEILDEAVDAAVLTGLLALQEARTAPDRARRPSGAWAPSPTSRSRSPWQASTWTDPKQHLNHLRSQPPPGDVGVRVKMLSPVHGYVHSKPYAAAPERLETSAARGRCSRPRVGRCRRVTGACWVRAGCSVPGRGHSCGSR